MMKKRIFWLWMATLLGCGKNMFAENGPLNLSGEQYWNNPEHAADSIINKRLDEQADGMVIDAPSKVDLTVHPSVPVLCHRSGDSRKLFKYNLETTTQLVICHLESGDIQVVKLAESPVERNAPTPSPGWSTDWLELDLAQWVDLGPKLGNYNLWLACGPEASNLRTTEISSLKHAGFQGEYSKRVQELNTHGTVAFDPHSYAAFSIDHAPSHPPHDNEASWVLSQETGVQGGSRFRIQFRIPGLPGFVFPSGEKKSDPAGRHIFGHVPMLVFGFDKNRTLILLSHVDLPIVEKPEGLGKHLILSGNISFRLPDLDKAGIRDEPQDVWAVAMDHRAYIHVKPKLLK